MKNNSSEILIDVNNYEQIKIIVADAQHIVRQGIVKLIESYKHFEVVGEAENGDVLVSQYDAYNPDIIVVDVAMPLMNGFEAVEEIRCRHSNVKALFLSGYNDDYLIYCSHSCGGMGFLLKAERVEKFITAINRIYSGFQSFPAGVGKIITKYDQKHEFTGYECKSIQKMLSKREIEIFMLYGTGRTTKQISDILHICKKQ